MGDIKIVRDVTIATATSGDCIYTALGKFYRPRGSPALNSNIPEQLWLLHDLQIVVTTYLGSNYMRQGLWIHAFRLPDEKPDIVPVASWYDTIMEGYQTFLSGYVKLKRKQYLKYGFGWDFNDVAVALNIGDSIVTTYVYEVLKK